MKSSTENFRMKQQPLQQTNQQDTHMHSFTLTHIQTELESIHHMGPLLNKTNPWHYKDGRCGVLKKRMRITNPQYSEVSKKAEV